MSEENSEAPNALLDERNELKKSVEELEIVVNEKKRRMHQIDTELKRRAEKSKRHERQTQLASMLATRLADWDTYYAQYLLADPDHGYLRSYGFGDEDMACADRYVRLASGELRQVYAAVQQYWLAGGAVQLDSWQSASALAPRFEFVDCAPSSQINELAVQFQLSTTTISHRGQTTITVHCWRRGPPLSRRDIAEFRKMVRQYGAQSSK